MSQYIPPLFKNRMRLTGLLMLAVLVLAACQSAATQPPATKTAAVVVVPTQTTAPTAVPTEPPTATTFPEPTISVANDPALGSILVGDKGMTLYIFTKDEADKSNCDAACLEKWPPLLTQGKPNLGEGVDDSKVGTASLADGTLIVTYNHMPLYYWYKDTKAGDTTGQGVGEVWFVVNPDGEKVEQAVSSSSGTPAASNQEPTISVANDPALGPILVGDKGMTLYIFTKDEADKSNCDAACLEKWPPLLTQGKPNLGEGVDDSKVGTASLADGTLIVTYNHMPLYYWFKDTKAGDTTGQGVGEVWFVINPDGEKVEQAVSSSSGTPAAANQEPTISVVNDPTLGPILVGDNGMTLYMYTRDLPDTVNCNAACLEKWPPLLTQGKPNLGEGVDDSKIGTASLPDGTLIVTYNHMPLYYWVDDKKAGDTTGQGVGEVWYVVNPDGEVVK